MGREYSRAHRKVVAALDSDRYLELLDSLDNLLANPPVETPEAEFPEAVPEVIPQMPNRLKNHLHLPTPKLMPLKLKR